MRMPAENISIEVIKVKRNTEEANKLEKIHIHFIIEGAEIVETKMQRVMELTKKNCSMVQSVIESIEIVETYEISN